MLASFGGELVEKWGIRNRGAQNKRQTTNDKRQKNKTNLTNKVNGGKAKIDKTLVILP